MAKDKQKVKSEQLNSILGRIRQEKEDFRTKSVRIANGYTFNQYSTLQRVELYYNSKFETGEYDEDGFKKYFYNINRQPCDIATKEIDLDTKDILLRAENGDYVLAEIMARELKQWMKDQGFAKDLNEYADDVPKYGSVVVKKVPKTGRLHLIDLVNGFIITNQNAKDLNHTNIIEPHLYTFDELRLTSYDQEKIEEVIALYEQLGKSEVEVDERYGWVRESELKPNGSSTKMVYSLAVVAGCEEVERSNDSDTVVEKGIVIYHEPIKKHPYKEWHFARVKKRWLGLGFVETLMDPQMARNESKYYKRKGMLWTTLHIWQTDDETVNKNLLLDVKDGDVLKRSRGTSPIEAVPMEERSLAEYQSEDNDWDMNARNLTFGNEPSAERLPSNTPATTTAIMDANIKRFFDRKREDFAIWVKSMLLDDILPMFVEDNSEEHIFALSGSYKDRDMFEQLLLEARLTSIFNDYVEKNGKVPSLQEWTNFQQLEATRMAQRPSLDIVLPKEFYNNFKIKLDIVITKESEDTDAKLNGRMSLINLIGSNPGVIMNPMTRPMVLELAEIYGIRNLRIPNISMGNAQMMNAPAQGGMGMPGMPAQSGMPNKGSSTQQL